LCLSRNVKKSENLSDLNKKDRNKRHSSPFINVVKGVFFVVRVALVPVSYLSAPSATGYQESLFVGWKVYSSSTNKAKNYSYSIFVQQMYWLQDKYTSTTQTKSICVHKNWKFYFQTNIIEVQRTRSKIQLFFCICLIWDSLSCSVKFNDTVFINFKFYYRYTILTMSTGPPAQDQSNFVRTSNFFNFHL
jgi:hypothetical protein